ncbi:unnamed protein product [Amoebophrya sp. A120]|nr:unnamed protein product [Amoebophrya sp. A120]|eukprot:GSA120T00017786001.1
MNPIRFLQVNSYGSSPWGKGCPAVCMHLEQAVHHNVTDAQKLQMAQEYLAGGAGGCKEVAFITLRAGKNFHFQVFDATGELKMPLHERSIIAAAHTIYRGVGPNAAAPGSKPKPVMIFDTTAGPATMVVKRVAVDLGSRMLHRYEIKLPCLRGRKILEPVTNPESPLGAYLFECLYSVGKFNPPVVAKDDAGPKKTNRFAARSEIRAENTLAFKGLANKAASKVVEANSGNKTDDRDDGPVEIPFLPTEGSKSNHALVLLYASEEAIRKMKFDCDRYVKEVEANPSTKLNVGYIVATAPSKSGKTDEGEDCTFVTRVFDGSTGEEQEATGSVMSTLMPFWNEKLQEPKLFNWQLSPRKAHIVAEIGPNQGKVAGDPDDEFNDAKDQVLMSGVVTACWEGMIPEELFNPEAVLDQKGRRG